MNSCPKILIVDDDQELGDLLAEVLPGFGFQPKSVRSGLEMHQALESSGWDLIILDVMIPGEDGLSLCRNLRARGGPLAGIPIIFLTALDDLTDRVVGLEVGGDDYLGKPFQARELVARIRALLRRTRPKGEPPAGLDSAAGRRKSSVVRFENWRLNIPARHLTGPSGVVISLSTAEFRLLLLFLDHPQQVLSRDQILAHLAERHLNVYDRTIDAQVSRLRAKLGDRGPNPSLIKTVRGDGYMLTVPAEPEDS
ncbi:MAG: response regulator transcription factor [Deltaproteobacteria bacterium]|jgi:two-component system OmpR family response regulator|nr:response regulator transcription factor [Deltaproteobacteria bacterium]